MEKHSIPRSWAGANPVAPQFTHGAEKKFAGFARVDEPVNSSGGG
jgi:hypothetical protein